MDSRKIKHKIALSCNGDLRKYFNKVKIINRIINEKNLDKKIESIHKN